MRRTRTSPRASDNPAPEGGIEKDAAACGAARSAANLRHNGAASAGCGEHGVADSWRWFCDLHRLPHLAWAEHAVKGVLRMVKLGWFRCLRRRPPSAESEAPMRAADGDAGPLATKVADRGGQGKHRRGHHAVVKAAWGRRSKGYCFLGRMSNGCRTLLVWSSPWSICRTRGLCPPMRGCAVGAGTAIRCGRCGACRRRTATGWSRRTRGAHRGRVSPT